MAHKIYDNFYLSNEVEDQFNSHLDLQQFCTVDNSLVGTAGMKRKIRELCMQKVHHAKILHDQRIDPVLIIGKDIIV